LLSVALAAQGIAAYHFGYKTNMFLFDPVTRAEYSAPSDEGDSSDQAAQQDTTESISDTRDQPEGFDDSPGSFMKRIRGLGLLHDPNDLALGLVMALPLVWAGSRKRAFMRNVLLIWVPSGVLLYGLYLTRSRGGALAFVVTLCAAASRKIGRIPAILLFVVLISGGFVVSFASGRALSTTDEAVSGRFDAWSEGLQMLKSQPLLGVGYGLFIDHHDLTAHNSLVLCFAETGLIGYFFWFGLLLITFAQLHGLKNLPGEEPIDVDLRDWASTLQLSLIGFMTAAMFLSRTFIPMLYLLIGLSVALTLIARQAMRPVWTPSFPRLGSLVLASEVASILIIYMAVKFHLV
jgi:O-antigen ligase/polysaccharide polymerase Wzy-like membrane protein